MYTVLYIIITFYISPHFSSFVGNRQAFYTDVCSCVFQIFVRRRRCGRWWYRRKILPEHYLLHRLMIIAGCVCLKYISVTTFSEKLNTLKHTVFHRTHKRIGIFFFFLPLFMGKEKGHHTWCNNV